MDPDKQPTSSAAGGSANGDIDESSAADILNAAAASKSDGGTPPAPAGPDTSANGAANVSTSGAAPAGPATGASSTSSAAGGAIASPADIVNAAAADATVASPTAPSPSASPLPDSPTPNLDNRSSSVLGGGAPAGMVTPKKSKKGLIGGIVAVLVILVLGGSAAAYYQIMNKPQNVLDMALQNSFSPTKASSVDFDGSLDIKPKDSSTYSTNFTGSSDSATGAMSLNAKIDAMVTTVNVDVRTTDGKTLYLRLSGLDGLSSLLGASGASAADDNSELSFLAPAIAAVNNQWIQINQSMIQQLTGSKDDVTTRLSPDDLKKVADAYKKNRFLVASKSFKDETIKGKASKHYQVTVDKTKLKNFVAAVKAANIDAFKSLTSDTVKQLDKQIDSADFSKYPADVWIAKSDKMIDQVAFSVSSDGDNVHLRYTVDDYNKPVKVTAPANAKSFLDILSQALGGGLGGSSDLNSLTDGSGISL